MKLRTKFMLALLPPVIVFLVGLGLWSSRQAAQGIGKTASNYLDGVLHTFVSQELESRRQILVMNQLDKVPSFVTLYQREAAKTASAFKLLWPGHIYAFDSNDNLVFDTANRNRKAMEAVWGPVLSKLRKTPQGDYGRLGKEMYRSAVFKPWGWQVFVAIDVSETYAAEFRIYMVTLLVTLGSVGVIMVILGLVFRRFVGSPITILREATTRISARLPVEAVSVSSRDEIGSLARDIEKMAHDISSYQYQLLQLAETLEQKVEERTAELIKSEAGLAKAQEIAQVGSWEWDVAGGRVHWSDEVFRILGFQPQAFAAGYKRFMACVHPNDRGTVKSRLYMATRENKSFKIEYLIVRPNGEERIVRGIGEPSADQSGHPVRIVGTIQDITDLAAAEAALRDSRKQLEMAIKASQIVVWHWDVVNDSLVWDAGASGSVDVDSTAAVMDSRSFGSLLHPDDLGRVVTALKASVHQDREFDVDFRMTGKDGTERHFITMGAVVRDDEGRPLKMHGVGIDVTERKHAEQALLDSEELKSKILNGMSDGLAIADMDGRIVQVNQAMSAIYGYSEDELTNLLALQLIRPDYHGVFMNFKKQLIETGGFSGETVDIKKDGSEINTEIRGALLHHKEAPYLLAIIRDVTDRKRVETALRESEERFRAIFESTSDCIIVWDKEYNILFANQASIDRMDTLREDVIGKNIRDLPVHQPEFKGLWINRIDRAIEKGRPFRVEDVDRIGDRKVYSESVVSPILGQDGDVFAVGVVYRDITERKELERAISEHARRLSRTNTELAQKNAELDEFTYVASHDLQEPLRKLTSFSNLLQKDLGEDLPDRARSDLFYIVDAAGRMQTLVQDLLHLSRTGRAAMRQAVISPKQCAQKALDALSVRLEETGAKIEWDDLPEVMGDEALLVQLYQNLIGNGLKFTGRNAPVIRLGCEKNKGDLVFGVRDNGIGIKSDYAEQIFSPFKRLHSRSEYEGTGIGLAICRKIVEMHGGKIWVESEPGRGSHFKFTLQPVERSMDHG